MPSYYDNSYLNTIQTSCSHLEPRLRLKRSGVSAELQRGRNHSLQLAKAVILQLPPHSKPSMLQDQALGDWRRVKQQYSTYFVLPDRKEMLHIIQISSSILFFGKLHRVEVEWVTDLCKTKASFPVTYAPGAEHTHWVNVAMDPVELLDKSDAPDHFTRIISTLRHECIHAFLLSYSFAMPCTDAECDRTWSQIVGETFHGMAFLQIATYMEALPKQTYSRPPTCTYGTR